MDYKKIGAEIRRLRSIRGVTQRQLGAAIMRSESSIAKYEQGLVEIPPSVLMDIADFLGVDGIDLLGVANSSPQPAPFSVAFKWLESLGYKIIVYEEESYRSVILRDTETFEDHIISDSMLHNLVENIAAYSRFQIAEMIKSCPQPPQDAPQSTPAPTEDQSTTPPPDAPETPPEGK